LAILGGATMIQLREKKMTGRELYETAKRLLSLCRPLGIPLIVNDRLDIALASGADGVHLGAEDLSVYAAKRLVPEGFIVGATAHSVEEGRRAEAEGADYVGVGAAFPSGTKKGAAVLGVAGIREVCSAISLPTVAIGGITAENAREVLDAGVDGVSVVASVVGHEDIQAAASLLAKAVIRGSYE
jgi:thiamine-phosphate pyrophosphorylase